MDERNGRGWNRREGRGGELGGHVMMVLSRTSLIPDVLDYQAASGVSTTYC